MRPTLRRWKPKRGAAKQRQNPDAGSGLEYGSLYMYQESAQTRHYTMVAAQTQPPTNKASSATMAEGIAARQSQNGVMKPVLTIMTM